MSKCTFRSPRSDPHKDGAQHPGGGGARVHREAALRLPDRGQALPHPRLPQGRRSLHQAVQRGERKKLATLGAMLCFKSGILILFT